MLDRDASSAVNECEISTPQSCGMAPSPETDSAPKAPDKPRAKDDKGLSDLNDGELKGLLDEALNYKNPKDREGKSKLFNHLLNEAEEDERNARAARAGGSELVRYCNPSAKRNSRHRKKPSSISENMMHGGSLDNLAKEELFETSKHRTKKSVSARQREGGSLPCNVNSSTINSHEYQFFEEARKKKEMTEKKEVVEEQRLLEHDTLDQNYQEKNNEQHNQYKYTSRACLQVNEVDGPLQIPSLEQTNDRKNCLPSKSVPQNDYTGTTIRISNEKKMDENGNAVPTSLKTKKKKVLTDKNVVVCNAENVKGHRSDIINDMDKLMEFIGTDDQSEKNRSIKSKLNRHSSDDTKSKKRAHSSKSKDNRSKLKKSNSLGEISTTNLDDFEFENDKVVLRNNKNVEKPRERRSWGNMEPLPLQNLYNNASAENLESAEFRVVTKKKKSKKRRNSISGRTKGSTPGSKGGARGPSPDMRRKSACSVPHSEKSNDSSDVDSVHSLPIDTQRLDLATARLNTPISYADMAKNNEKIKERKTDKVPKDVTCVLINSCDLNKNDACVKIPPDVHNIKNFPAISKVAVQVNVDKMKYSNKIRNVNVKNNVNKIMTCAREQLNHLQNDFMMPSVSDDSEMGYSSSLPADIPDVQTIEKLQLINQGHPSNCYDSPQSPLLNNGNDCSVDCDNNQSERTSYTVVDNRPPVVILSGNENKEVSDLVFGFDINEQLLSEDNKDFCCDDFITRYVAPETYTATSHNHDKIVTFIGAGHPEKLHIQLLHYKQKFNWDCGISCVLMVLPKKHRNHLLKNFTRICKEEGFYGSTWTIDLCYLLKRYEVGHVFYTVTLGVHPGYRGNSFYNHILTKDEARVNRRFETAKTSDIVVEKASVSCQKILDHLVNGPVIILTNARLLNCDICKLNKISTELRKCIPWPTPYQGHYVVLCGYDIASRKVYYRNPSFADRVCVMSVDVLESARKSYGTDEDVILIYK